MKKNNKILETIIACLIVFFLLFVGITLITWICKMCVEFWRGFS